MMITDHRVSANSHFRKEEVGSNWSGGVAVGADQPSDGKAHLEGKQSTMEESAGAQEGLHPREREGSLTWGSEKAEKKKILVQPQLCHLLVTYHLLESLLTFLNFIIPFCKIGTKIPTSPVYL